jgi:hypothetical protein
MTQTEEEFYDAMILHIQREGPCNLVQARHIYNYAFEPQGYDPVAICENIDRLFALWADLRAHHLSMTGRRPTEPVFQRISQGNKLPSSQAILGNMDYASMELRMLSLFAGSAGI